MKFSTLLSLQVFFIAFLYTSASKRNALPTLDGLIKALGSLYQSKLFSLRDDAAEIENLRNQLDMDGTNEAEVYETVTIPRQYICMKTIPYCLAFYASIIVQNKPLENNIRNGKQKTCFSDFEFGSCPYEVEMDDSDPVVDVSQLRINDFCVPGEIEVNGTLDVFRDITSNSSIYVEFDSVHKRNDDDLNFSKCLNGGQYCSYIETCSVIMGDVCTDQGSYHNYRPYPCACPIKSGTYNMNGFTKTLNKFVDFGWGRMEGFLILMADKKAKSCVSFSFTKTAKMS